MDLVVAKILTAIALFTLTALFSYLPYLLLRLGSSSGVTSPRQLRVVAYLNCFAGGVFLGTLLMHILAEGSEQFESYKEAVGLHTEFPLFNLLVAAGFFLVAFVELIAQSLLHHHHGNKAGASLNTERVAFIGASSDSASLVENSKGCRVASGAYGATNKMGAAALDTEHLTKSSVSDASFTPGRQGQERGDQQDKSSLPGPPGLQAFLLLIALSFHTIFDGLAVGLQSHVTEVWSVFAAVTIHKSVIAFCLGVELFQTSAGKPVKTFLWLGIFALMSPLGIATGIGLTSGGVDETAKLLASSVLQGLAAGTFLYVTFLEILAAHIGHAGTGSNVWYVLTTLVGFCIMAASKLFDQD